ncbi:MAG: helicase-associated domain-containing protein, partial [Planctomycetes bacterium]|nr:helicase-associated domain-containing protein [Planctomycetota bacterium]
RGSTQGANPYPSAYLLALLLLTRLPEGAWCQPAAVEQWVGERHPYWSPRQEPGKDEGGTPEGQPGTTPSRPLGLRSFLLGVAYPLRLLQAARSAEGEWVVRLAPLGRRLLGLGEEAEAEVSYKQTLLVQPNLEMVAYRQGLTPGLIARLGQFAAWKSLGAACTLQLQPDTVYRALESGQTFETILQTLEQHGMRPTPASVLESLKTWANKRERLGVYPSATLFEFNSAEDLQEALARGLPGVRLSERLAVVANESAIDFRHFRLAGTRDYGLPPEKCVEVAEDGVSLTIDLARSDLLLETEMQRFAELLDSSLNNGRRQYRLTPASLTAGRESGLGLRALEEWFLQRTGKAMSPAARLLLAGPLVPPMDLRRQLVLHVSTAEVADGLMQWPETRSLLLARLGPTTLAVAEEKVEELRQRLGSLGLTVALESGNHPA